MPSPGAHAPQAAECGVDVAMSPRVPLRLAIFDLDGVLVDSWGLMQRALSDAVAACGGGGGPPVEAFRHQLGKPLPRIAAVLGLPPSFVPAYVDSSRRNVGLVKPFDGVVGGLGRLREHGLRLAVATGKDRHRSLELLDRFGLRHHFAQVVGGDDVDHGKPHPEALAKILEEQGVEQDEAVFIGDTPLDARCAAAAGVRLLAVAWGIASCEELHQAGATHIAADVPQLFEWIRQLQEGSWNGSD